MPATIGLGTFTFTMSALPGTPAIQNAIPMPFFGTTLFAAPGLGIIASAIMLGFGLWWLGRAREPRAALARATERARLSQWARLADDPRVRELATGTQEFDPVEMRDRHPSEFPPPVGLAVLPLVVVLGVNLIMSLAVLPRLDVAFLAEARWGETSFSGGGWHLGGIDRVDGSASSCSSSSTAGDCPHCGRP